MLALTLAIALGMTPGEVPNPRPSGWVSDTADVIPADAEQRINARIESLHRDLGVEVAVVTVASADAGTPKQFTTTLFNDWGIGDAQRDDGLLVVLAVEQRRLEMETGYGLEGPLPDGWLGVMQSERMVPRFKQGDFGGGMEAGLEAVGARLRGQTVPPPRPVFARASSPVPEAVVENAAALIIGTLMLILLVAMGILWNWRRQRTCPECRIPMHPLAEDEEDAHLNDGQETEEAIGSRSWDVYQCPKCEHTRSFGHRHLFSGHSRCPSCGHRARTTDRQTVTYPTRYSTGLRRVTEDCAHCSYHNTHHVVLPMLPEPSSSSSSGSWGGGGGGGGGFGGGSSGGGGAGSSW